MLKCGVFLLTIQAVGAFQQVGAPMTTNRWQSLSRTPGIALAATDNNNAKEGGVEEYKNAATSILSNFMRKDKMKEQQDPFADIDFDAPKISKKNLATLASMLDEELYEKEWFVTGNVNPSFFADDFEFNDPDVKLSGIEGASRLVVIRISSRQAP